MRVVGTLSFKDKQPIPGATIELISTNTVVGSTDSDGRFAFTVNIGETVIFEHKNMTPTCKFIDPLFEWWQELEVSALKLID